MTTQLVPITKKEVQELRDAGGMKITIGYTYEYMKNDTMTVVIAQLQENDANRH